MMVKHSQLNRGIALVVIVLFIGLAFTPSINANVTTDSELVEITTEVCGIDGINSQTISLTKEDADTVEKLFDEIKSKLDRAETREETVTIFNEGIVELDKYGLFGDMDIEKIQNQISNRFIQPKRTNFLGKIVDFNFPFFSNLCCFMFTNVSSGYFPYSMEFNIWWLLALVPDIDFVILVVNFLILLSFFPLKFMNIVLLYPQGINFQSTTIYSLGFKGYKELIIPYDKAIIIYGFSGIKIIYEIGEQNYNAKLIGFALGIGNLQNPPF